MNRFLVGILGIAIILGIALLLSSNRRHIRLRVVGAAFAIQATIAVLVLYVPAGRAVIGWLAGGVAALLARRNEVGQGLRERFSRDFWRLASRPMPRVDLARPQDMLSTVNGLVGQFGALAGLASENMVRSAAWRFLEIGKRLERALATCRVASHLGAADDAEALGLLLELCDSQIIYRARYLTGPVRDPVLDLVLLDADNPRALMFQVRDIVDHLDRLPSLREDTLPEQPLREGKALLGMLSALTAAEMGTAQLAEVETRLRRLSDAISLRYFLQFEPVDDGTSGSLLE